MGEKARSTGKRELGARPVRFLLVIAGLALIVLSLTFDLLFGDAFSFGRANAIQAGVGGTLLVVGIVMPRGRFSAVLAKLSLLFLASLLFIGVAEVACRAIGVDFARGEEAFLMHPIYYRFPSVPVGESSFRRPGLQTWTGKVFTTELKARGIDEDLFPDERELTVTYDADGFRNPADLEDWEVVIAGDSFVESGYLPYEELFTTRVGRKLEKPVRNLGICFTGPLSHITYLREFGKSKGTRHAVLAFFEGNDVADLNRETETRERVRTEGRHSALDIGKKQTSFVRAILDWRARSTKGRRNEDAYVRIGHEEVKVTVRYGPRGSDRLRKDEVARLGQALTDWADTARDLDLVPWLLYLPCKHRVLHDGLRYADDTTGWRRTWKPTDLPAFVEKLCGERGIRFVNATSALLASVQAGRIPYNTVWDTHLNGHGSEVVATVLADALR